MHPLHLRGKARLLGSHSRLHPGCSYRAALLAARLGPTGTLSSSRAHDHQAGSAAPSRSHLVQAPASGPYNSQTHDKEGISCTSFYALATTPFGSKSGLPRAIRHRAPFIPLSHSKYTAMLTRGLMVNWEFQLLHLI